MSCFGFMELYIITCMQGLEAALSKLQVQT